MTGEIDIAVVGSGVAGIAAAVTAARQGGKTLLLDRRPAAGGIGGFSGLTTLCGLYDDQGNWLVDGFAREFASQLTEADSIRMGKVWVLPYDPERFRAVAARFLAALPQLETRWNTPLSEVITDGQRITHLNGIAVGAVIDCSGSAEIAHAIGAECRETDATTQAPAIIFSLSRVTRPLNSVTDAAQVLLPLMRAGLPPLSFLPSSSPDTLIVKFTGPADQIPPTIEFLRQNVSGFAHCVTAQTDFVPVERAGRMICGQYVLTGADVLAGRRFPDAVARCAWPIEQWNAQGQVRFQYLPPGTHYEIPARSLRAAHWENLFMAGKTISADETAIASARVMGCGLATGAAAGHLAATYLKILPANDLLV